MTKAISNNLKAELIGPLTRLATCMRIERTDGAVFGFTTHDKALTIDGLVYHPTASFNPTDIESQNNLDTDNLSVEGMLSDDVLNADELRAGYWDNARYRIFQVCWADLTMGQKKDRTGWLGDVSVHIQTFVTDLLGLMDAYTINFIETTTPGCRASLGDSRCKFSLSGSPSGLGSPPTALSVSGTLGVCDTDYQTLHDAARVEPDAYFDEGKITIEFPNGPRQYEVKAYIVGIIVTKTPVGYDATGCNYTMTIGCDRTFGTCAGRFNNAINFQGEPHLRGNDLLVQVGRRK